MLDMEITAIFSKSPMPILNGGETRLFCCNTVPTEFTWQCRQARHLEAGSGRLSTWHHCLLPLAELSLCTNAAHSFSHLLSYSCSKQNGINSKSHEHIFVAHGGGTAMSACMHDMHTCSTFRTSICLGPPHSAKISCRKGKCSTFSPLEATTLSIKSVQLCSCA